MPFLIADEADRLASLLSDMGPQLRTPLNGVIGMAGVLGQTRLDPGQQQMAQVIESSGCALNGLLNDILDLARLEAGSFELDERPFNLAEVAEGLQRRLAPELVARGAALKLKLSPRAAAIEVIGDEAVVRQLLSRLVRRALACVGRSELCVDLTLGADGGVAIEIDGMAPAARATEAGADIELALCRRLSAAMGGALEVKPGPAGGDAGYRLLLPLQLCEAQAA
jgi:signal transduction histidine kinase